MQVKYTTASILLLTPVLAAPNAALVERGIVSDIESAVSTGINIVTSDFDVATSDAKSIIGSIATMIYSDATKELQALESGAAVIISEAVNDPLLLSAGKEVQSLATEAAADLSIALTAAGPIASSLSAEAAALLSSAEYIATSVYDNYDELTTLTSSAVATNTATNNSNLVASTSSTAGAAMPTSGLGISLAGLAGIVGVIAIALWDKKASVLALILIPYF